MQGALKNLNAGVKSEGVIFNSDLSIIKENQNHNISPRSHG